MLGDYKTFIEVWGEAVNSTGFSADQVGMQLDTLSRRMGKLKADIEGMAVGTGNSGLTVWMKEHLAGIDNIIVGLKKIPKEVYMVGVGIGALAGIMKFASYAMNQYTIATTGATLASRTLARSNLIAAGLMALAAVLSQVVEHYGALANAERNAVQAGEDNIAIAEQQIEQAKKQGEFIDSLFSARGKLIAQTNDATVTDEKKIELTKNVGVTEVELGKILGAEAIQRIKDNNWSMESINAEKTEFQKSVTAKQDALVIMRAEMAADLDNKIIWLNNCVTAYYDEAAAFGDSISRKIKALGIWKAAQVTANEWQAKFWEIEIAGAERTRKGAQESGDQDTLNVANERIQKAEANIRELQGVNTAIIKEGAKDWESQLAENKAKRLQVVSGGVNFNPAQVGGRQVSDSGDGNVPKDKTSGSTPPNDPNKVIARDAYKDAITLATHRAKLATDEYAASLDNLNTTEEMYGKTADTTVNRLDLMQKRWQALNDQEWESQTNADTLNAQLDTMIGDTGALGVSKDDWKAMTPLKRAELKVQYRDVLDAHKDLKAVTSAYYAWEDKASKERLEKTKLGNDIKKAESPYKPEELESKRLQRNKTTEEILIAQNTNKFDGNNDRTLNAIHYKARLEDAKVYDDALLRLKGDLEKAKKKMDDEATDGKKDALQKIVDQTQDAYDKTLLAATNNANDIKNLEYSKNAKIKEGFADIIDDVVVKGGSLKEIWGNLWNQLASSAIKALFQVQSTGGGLLESIFGLLGGGSKGGIASSATRGGTAGLDASILGVIPSFFANGGLTDKPAIFGEDGIEMAIPMTPSKRPRALELLGQTQQMLGVGTKVVPNISSRTQQIAQEASGSREELAELKESNELLRSLCNIMLNKEMGGGGQGGVIAPVVMPTTQGDGELWAQISRMRLQGYKV